LFLGRRHWQVIELEKVHEKPKALLLEILWSVEAAADSLATYGRYKQLELGQLQRELVVEHCQRLGV
jgi:hypothetical protein